MLSTRPSARAGGAAAIGLLLALAAPVPRSASAATPRPAARAPLPDSARAELLALWRQHDYFRLRDRLRALGEPEGPWALFFRAAVAGGFGREAASDSILERLSRAEGPVPDSVRFEAARLRYQNDMKLYHYGAALADARPVRASPLADSARKADVANGMRLLEALKDVPPQTTESRSGATLHPDGRGRVAVVIDSTLKRYAFDSGANFSVLMRSEAEGLGLRVRPADVKVGSSTDLQVRADLAVADRVEVGGAVLRHVVFLVLPDSALTFPGGFEIQGILGFPVQRALGALAYRKDGSIRIPARPGEGAGGTLAFHQFTPFVPVTLGSDTLACQLDTGSGHTVLFEPFYRTHRGWIDSAGRVDTVTAGGAGGMRRLPVRILPRTSLGVAGARVTLDSLRVYTSRASWQDEHLMCLVGRDALKGFDEYVIDYDHMGLALR